MRADRGADAGSRCRVGSATQSRSASSIAARSVRSPLVTGTTSAPSSRMRPTFGACRSMSTAPMYTVHGRPKRAQAAALATPCWPAPVSATMRFAPRRFASSAWPIALLILCAPVCARSSRFSQILAPQRSDSRAREGERRGPADPGLQLARELVLESVGVQMLAHAVLEALERRDQRLRHIAAAERAEAAAARRGICRRWHRRADAGRRGADRTLSYGIPHARHSTARAASRSSRSSAGLLMPGRASTPLDTSTPKGRTLRDGGRDIVGIQAAGEHHFVRRATPLRGSSSRTARHCRWRGLRTEQRAAGSVDALGCRRVAQHRQQLELRAAARSARDPAVGLQDVRLETLAGSRRLRLGVGWRVTATQRTRPRAGAASCGGLRRRDLAHRLGEHEADRVDAGVERRGDRLRRRHAADLDPHGVSASRVAWLRGAALRRGAARPSAAEHAAASAPDRRLASARCRPARARSPQRRTRAHPRPCARRSRRRAARASAADAPARRAAAARPAESRDRGN